MFRFIWFLQGFSPPKLALTDMVFFPGGRPWVFFLWAVHDWLFSLHLDCLLGWESFSVCPHQFLFLWAFFPLGRKMKEVLAWLSVIL